MKKKAAAKKKAVGQSPKIGGTVRGRKQPSWPKVGRKRLDQGADPVEPLAQAMKKAREAKKMPIGSLARELNVAPATLIKFEERNHPISVGIVLQMAEKLGYELELSRVGKRKK